MSTEADRRAPGATRIPFEALVEVGGALGPSFEAQAVDISEDGMHLRTAYLPDIGQPLTCRFDAGAGSSVLAAGEVCWREENGRGGEFGIRFTNLDADSNETLRRILGLTHDLADIPPGARVRLHIDGLGAPMRARIRETHGAEVTAFSELGFFQAGRPLELEDASNGAKRRVRVDRVEIEVDAHSAVPQLVVRLRYDDLGASAGSPARIDAPRVTNARGVVDGSPEPSVVVEAPQTSPSSPMDAGASAAEDEELAAIQKASEKMKGSFARRAAAVGPAVSKMANRAKTTLALLWAKRKQQAGEESTPMRRTTAPAPGGGLHAAGRKVVRGEPVSSGRPSDPPSGDPVRFRMTKRKAAVAGAVGVATILAVVALRKPSPPAEAPVADVAANTAATPPATPAPLAAAPGAPGAPLQSVQSASNGFGASGPVDPNAVPMPAAQPLANASGPSADGASADHPKKIHVPPFGNGPVSHGNVLRIKMDGPIEKIEGATQPNGFTVVVPSRKSLEAAAPLAARDGRLASIRVTNDANGAELAVAFKDGVPNYQVRAKNDVLEIVLAPIGQARNEHEHRAGEHDVAAAPHKGHKKHPKH